MKTPPEAAICKECDLRMLCQADGLIGVEALSTPTRKASTSEPLPSTGGHQGVRQQGPPVRGRAR